MENIYDSSNNDSSSDEESEIPLAGHWIISSDNLLAMLKKLCL